MEPLVCHDYIDPILVFIGGQPITWPANNRGLQIMVFSCATSSNCVWLVWLQKIFCSCVNKTTLFSFSRLLLRENGSFPKIFIERRTLLISTQVSLAGRLDKKWEGDFFWIDLVRVLFYRWPEIRLRSQAIRVYNYTKFKGLHSRTITSKGDENTASWLRSHNDSYSQFPRSTLETPGTFCAPNKQKNGLQIMSQAAL